MAGPKPYLRVVDLDRHADVVSRGRLANTYWTRLRGLLGTKPLQPGEGLLLSPCDSIHMFFMSYAIDAIYLDRKGTVLRVVSNLRPWRVGPLVRHTHQVLELPPGQATRCGLRQGDRLLVTENSPAPRP